MIPNTDDLIQFHCGEKLFSNCLIQGMNKNQIELIIILPIVVALALNFWSYALERDTRFLCVKWRGNVCEEWRGTPHVVSVGRTGRRGSSAIAGRRRLLGSNGKQQFFPWRACSLLLVYEVLHCILGFANIPMLSLICPPKVFISSYMPQLLVYTSSCGM